jgi:hypothetical protein
MPGGIRQRHRRPDAGSHGPGHVRRSEAWLGNRRRLAGVIRSVVTGPPPQAHRRGRGRGGHLARLRRGAVAVVCAVIVLWRRGVSQGCPLSPLFASFVVARLLKPIDKLLRQRASDQLASGNPGNDGFGGISHLLGYVDDISSCIYLHDLPFLCNTLKSLGASLGCFVNSSKTRTLT